MTSVANPNTMSVIQFCLKFDKISIETLKIIKMAPQQPECGKSLVLSDKNVKKMVRNTSL